MANAAADFAELMGIATGYHAGPVLCSEGAVQSREA